MVVSCLVMALFARLHAAPVMSAAASMAGAPDGKVDIIDLALVSRCFGSHPGHERWDSRADITGREYLIPDDKVDVSDLALVSACYGTYPGHPSWNPACDVAGHDFSHYTSVMNTLAYSSKGIKAMCYQTANSSALYYAFLDTTDWNYKIIAYDLSSQTWTRTQIIAPSSYPDSHYTPCVGVMPNGSIGVWYAYLQPLCYRLSAISAQEESNVTRIISSWGPEQTVPGTENMLCSYPDVINFVDRTLVYYRTGSSTLGNWSQATFTSTWTLKDIVYLGAGYNQGTICGTAWKVADRIYLDYTRYFVSNRSRQNIYLAVTEDKGETWKSWNGTVLDTPFEATQCKVAGVPPNCLEGSVWNDENGNTKILYVTRGNPAWGSMANATMTLHILKASSTAPNAGITWTSSTLRSESNNTIYGNGYAFLDTYFSRTTLWVTPYVATGGIYGSYATKYMQANGSDFIFRKYYQAGDSQLFAGVPSQIMDYTGSCEIVSSNWARGYCGNENQLPGQKTIGTIYTWRFRYVASRNGTINRVVMRINITDPSSIGMYSVYVWNSAGKQLAHGDDQEPGTYGQPPRDVWESTPLNMSFRIVAGQTYWIGFNSYTYGAGERFFYQNQTGGNNGAYTRLGWYDVHYLNMTCSIYLAGGETVFYGFR